MTDVLISGTHAAELIGVSPPTFYRMAKDEPGLEPAPTTGRSVAWSLDKVLEWLSKRDERENERRAALVSQWIKAGSHGVSTQ